MKVYVIVCMCEKFAALVVLHIKPSGRVDLRIVTPNHYIKSFTPRVILHIKPSNRHDPHIATQPAQWGAFVNLSVVLVIRISASIAAKDCEKRNSSEFRHTKP